MVVMNTIPFTIADGVPASEWATLNEEWLKEVLAKHDETIKLLEVDKYQLAYDGQLESIEAREKARGDDINHKLQVNYAQLIIDMPVDYMTGKPITWTVYDSKGKASEAILTEYREELLELLKGEETMIVLAEVLRQGGIGGYSGLITYVDEEGNISYNEYPIQELIPIYDTRGRLKLVLRVYDVEEAGEKFRRMEYYDKRYVAFYKAGAAGTSFELDTEEEETGNPIEHKAAQIPVSIYVNGTPSSYEKRQRKAGVSDLDNGVMSLLENYAHVMSDKANTVENLLDQYLLLEGVTTDEKEVIKMRRARALVLKSKDSKASFIAPKQEDTAVENHANRLQETIHNMSFTPRLTDLSGATAFEIRMKYSSLDIKAGKKERHFLLAVRHFIRTLTDMLNMRRLIAAGVKEPYEVLEAFNKKVKSPEEAALVTDVELFNPLWVDITINRNLPQNYAEVATIVGTLSGLVPDTYLYELLWFVEDPVAALEEMKKQKDDAAKAAAKAGLASMGFGGEFGNTGNEDEDEETDSKDQQGGAQASNT